MVGDQRISAGRGSGSVPVRQEERGKAQFSNGLGKWKCLAGGL